MALVLLPTLSESALVGKGGTKVDWHPRPNYTGFKRHNTNWFALFNKGVLGVIQYT